MLWSASQLVQPISMCISTVTQGSQRMTTTWVSCSPCFSPEIRFIIWLWRYLYWWSLQDRVKNSFKGDVFLLRISRMSTKCSGLSCFFFLCMLSLMESFGGSHYKKYPIMASLELEGLLSLGVGGSWGTKLGPNRLPSSAGASSSQLNTSLLSLCLGLRLNMVYPEQHVYKQIQREIVCYSSKNNNSDFT